MAVALGADLDRFADVEDDFQVAVQPGLVGDVLLVFLNDLQHAIDRWPHEVAGRIRRQLLGQVNVGQLLPAAGSLLSRKPTGDHIGQ